MPARNIPTAHGVVQSPLGGKNRLDTATGIRLKAGVLVMPKSDGYGGVPPTIGEVQTIGRDGLVSVRWYRPEQAVANIADGTVNVDSHMMKVPPSDLLAIAPQRAHLRF